MPRAGATGRSREREGRPTPGELLVQLPAWPREWAQRLGREASELGARAQVKPSSNGEGWELCWRFDRHAAASLRTYPQGVRVEVLVPERAVGPLLGATGIDAEFQRDLERSTPRRGCRRFEVGLESALRTRTLIEALRLLARTGPSAGGEARR